MNLNNIPLLLFVENHQLEPPIILKKRSDSAGFLVPTRKDAARRSLRAGLNRLGRLKTGRGAHAEQPRGERREARRWRSEAPLTGEEEEEGGSKMSRRAKRALGR